MKALLFSLFVLVCICGCAVNAAVKVPRESEIPKIQREFRAVWVATVDNIDWPSKKGLPVKQQKDELIAIFDKCVELKLNAVILQIRPMCDALYKSDLEPWSEFLTGKQGQAPDPYYDPLQFAIDEAHKRGLELHVWFNPYRAWHPSAKGEADPNHITVKRPDIARPYGKHKWMNPTDVETQKHSLAVMTDVVRRYDIDGVHIDDYFYPYKERDAAGKIIDFPDEDTYQKYKDAGGRLAKDDWRRAAVNTFVEDLYTAIKAEKKWVKFGISPFGIWRPGNPPQVKGLDQYAELYADARLWLHEGWLDYWTPQIYFRIDQAAQPYPALLEWWVGENLKGRHVWVGNFTGKVADGSTTPWTAQEVIDQIAVTRKQQGATGNVHFSMRAFMQNRGGLNDLLKAGPYATTALVPASPWLDATPPREPVLKLETLPGGTGMRVSWNKAADDDIRQWIVYARTGANWSFKALSEGETWFDIPKGMTPAVDVVAVSAIDRVGNESPRTAIAVQ